MIRAVLFDLDGTLADTAPDLGRVVNLQRERHSLPPLPLSTLRPYVSRGARGLLEVGFGLASDNPAFLPMREEFLSLYADNLYHETRLFDGIAELLNAL